MIWSVLVTEELCVYMPCIERDKGLSRNVKKRVGDDDTRSLQAYRVHFLHVQYNWVIDKEK